MKSRPIIILDTLFLCFISSILALVFFNYFTPYPLTIVYAVCAGSLAGLVFFARESAKRKATSITHKEKNEYIKIIDSLNFSTRAEQNCALEKALAKLGYSPERRKGAVKIKGTNAVAFMKFGFQKVDKADVLKAFNYLLKNETGYIISENFEKPTEEFAERFNGRIKLVNGISFYKKLKNADSLPSQKPEFAFPKKNKATFKNLLDKRKSGKLALFGIALLFFSYFSPLKIYYLVFGIGFLCFSLITRAFGILPEEKTVYSA